MKLLIPLTVLSLSFIIYYFFNTVPKSSLKEDTTVSTKKSTAIQTPSKHETKTPTPPLKTIEKNITLQDLRAVENLHHTLAKPTKVYLTLEDLRKKRQ